MFETQWICWFVNLADEYRRGVLLYSSIHFTAAVAETGAEVEEWLGPRYSLTKFSFLSLELSEC